MVLWILGLPASWRAGWQWHDALTKRWYDAVVARETHFPTPLHLITKYNGHSLVQLCHILPGALWAGLIPFQLHPGCRARHRRTHRLCGYVFAATSGLMMFGFWHIDKRKLAYMHADFPEIPLEAHTSWLPPALRVPHEPLFRGVAVWFCLTISMAVWHATRRRLTEHRKWILRHVGSGIWVAVQRLMVVAVNAEGPAAQKKTFGDAALFAAALTMGVAELAAWGYVPYDRKDSPAVKVE